jgi:hypothetical protein
MTPKNLRGMVGVEAKSRAYTWGRRTSWLMPSATEGFGAHRLYLPCRIAQLLLNRSIKARSFCALLHWPGFGLCMSKGTAGPGPPSAVAEVPKGVGRDRRSDTCELRKGSAGQDRHAACLGCGYFGKTTGPRGRSVRGFSGKGESVLLWEGPLRLLCPKLMVLNVRKPSNGTGAVVGGHRAEESGMGRGGDGPQGLKATAPNQLH